jgi:hypothetical protein
MTKLANLRLLSAIAIIGTTALSAGCMVHARASANAEADAPVTYAERPTLVAVGSGVWVVRASARATYYVNDSYWCYREGVWYRSSTYAGGWAVVETTAVPTVIVKFDHSVYVNYQGSATAQTKLAPGNDYVASNDKKDKDDNELPGVGNKRKAAGEQPGEVGKGLTKEKDPPKAAPPSSESSPKADKKEEKKPEKKDNDNNKGGKKK